MVWLWVLALVEGIHKPKYKQLAYTVGYFPEFRKIDQNSKIGMSLLNDTKEKKLAIYSRKGVQHYWDWGGEKYNNYQIIIHLFLRQSYF